MSSSEIRNRQRFRWFPSPTGCPGTVPFLASRSSVLGCMPTNCAPATESTNLSGRLPKSARDRSNMKVLMRCPWRAFHFFRLNALRPCAQSRRLPDTFLGKFFREISWQDICTVSGAVTRWTQEVGMLTEYSVHRGLYELWAYYCLSCPSRSFALSGTAAGQNPTPWRHGRSLLFRFLPKQICRTERRTNFFRLPSPKATFGLGSQDPCMASPSVP